jgi:hypothetical protein
MNTNSNQALAPTGSPEANHNEIDTLKSRLPLPDLMKKLGLGEYAKPSCKSPFRQDQNPSWGIFERDGRWYWKDLGTNESGDEINFLARYLGLKEDFDFAVLVHIYKHFADGLVPKERTVSTTTRKPNREGFGKGAAEQLARLSGLRGIRVDALELAQERGFLVFGLWRGYEVFGLTDASGRILEVRRLDGQLFPAGDALAERKSHALRHSQKSWPVGILQGKDRPMIMLVEGLPDFLAAHQIILDEGAVDRVAPVAMLSANVQIHKDALEHFRGKHVRMFPHADDAGQNGAAQWKQQLTEVGASKVDFIDFSLVKVEGKAIKDLNDILPHHLAGYRNDPETWRLL